MQKTIGITGSQGLIGSCLCSHFLAKGHTVIGIDNLSRYGEVERNHDHEKNFTLLKLDVRELKEEHIQNIDVFIHCAYESGGINWWNHHENEYYDRNRNISKHILNLLSVQSGIEKIVWFSSSQVYENETTFPTPEIDSRNLVPSSGYALEKLESEKDILRSTIKDKTIIIRAFNVIGKEEIYCKVSTRGHVVIDLAKKIIGSNGNTSIMIQGDGQQIRTLTTSSDLVEAVNRLLEKVSYGTYNVCGSEEMTILELAKMMWSLHYHSVPMINCKNNAVMRDVKRRIGLTKKLFDDAGWFAENNLSSILKEILNETLVNG
tara:strand:+ start:45 stop:1001 length:957 start_codon:yes stop_codon:yes gene_type:complete